MAEVTYVAGILGMAVGPLAILRPRRGSSTGRIPHCGIPAVAMPTGKGVIVALAAHAAFGRPLVNNVLRAILVEAIIHAALGDSDGWEWCSADWAECDFRHRDGIRLEVKQSAALQSWHREGEKPSRPSFDIAERTGYYRGSDWTDAPGRNADIYVFAHHPVTDQTADHREPAQWRFYVVAASALPAQKSISLARVARLADSVDVEGLQKAVTRVQEALCPS